MSRRTCRVRVGAAPAPRRAGEHVYARGRNRPRDMFGARHKPSVGPPDMFGGVS